MSSKLAVSTRFVDLDAMTSLRAAPSTEFDERVGQGVVDVAGVDELAQQRVHQSRGVGPVGRLASVVLLLIVGSEQLARPEEERRCVLAAGGHGVVGRILEPGPQPAGQSRVETGTGGGIPT